MQKKWSSSFVFWYASAAFVFLIFGASPAYAYIDPGSGSFILQMLLAGFFALMFGLRQVRDKIKAAFISKFSKKNENDPS